MTLTDYVNTAGLILDITGALFMYFNTPKIDSRIFIGNHNGPKAKDIRANKLIRFGIILLIIGFFLQAFSTFI